MEALPYIQQFHGRTIVIKLGGHAMVDPVVLENAIRDAVLLHYVGIRVIIAKRMDPQKVVVEGVEKEVDLGHVGEIEYVDPALLTTLLDKGYIPVIAPIAIDRHGSNLNINADTAAGDIAIALRAYKLINMTDVDGIMDEKRVNVFRKLSLKEAKAMEKSGIIGEGMIPKLNSVVKAVENGVPYAHIINGNIEHTLVLELFTRDGVGTMLSLS
jgi:acetylglutamate kinase